MFGMLRKSRQADTARTEEERMMDALRAHVAGCLYRSGVQIGDQPYPHTLVRRETVRDCRGGGNIALVDHGRYFTLWKCGTCGEFLAFEQVPHPPIDRPPATGYTHL